MLQGALGSGLPVVCKRAVPMQRPLSRRCPLARRHSAPLGTKRLQKPATPYPAAYSKRKARGTVRPLAEACEDVSTAPS